MNNTINITKELLEANGWEYKRTDYDEASFEEYSICIDNVSMIMSEDSNMIGRDWFVHIDNWDFETIGGCSVQTIKQFNDFMKVLDINYELTSN